MKLKYPNSDTLVITNIPENSNSSVEYPVFALGFLSDKNGDLTTENDQAFSLTTAWCMDGKNVYSNTIPFTDTNVLAVSGNLSIGNTQISGSDIQ